MMTSYLFTPLAPIGNVSTKNVFFFALFVQLNNVYFKSLFNEYQDVTFPFSGSCTLIDSYYDPKLDEV